ncbi:MAG: ABC transporter ATP-binding protein [Oscillospiraceae bacterium]|nr:ABC transporter ATP-binding protein [Oscillospiraceae bacterium]
MGNETLRKDTVLSVRNLKTYFYVDKHTIVKAVDDVSFDVKRGKITAIVGQSGSGKSVTSRSIFNLVDAPGKIVGGEVILNGRDVLKLSGFQQKKVYGKEISLIFQEPMSALNPVLKVKKQMMESILLHRKIPRKEALEQCRQALLRVNLKNADTILNQYPFELSGGMCQRVMIAMSMVAHPDVLVADEPTTALDLTIQAVVLEELKKLRDNGMAIMLITHDLGVVAQMADDVYVMHEGKIVESGDVFQIFDHPQHMYTKTLLSAVTEGGKRIGESD